MLKIILTLLVMKSAFATGSPYANIKLKPIATNDEGQVLFQSFSDVNEQGTYSGGFEKFGWLVVSAYGLWDERIAYDSSEIFDENSGEYKDKQKYEAYKNGKVNLKNPDEVLKKMLKKYYFNMSVEESNEKYKVLELKPNQSCFGGKCIDKLLPQKSLDGLVSTSLMPFEKAKPLRSSFYYKGVALLRTPFYVGKDTILHSKGDNSEAYESLFNLPTLAQGRDYIPAYVDSLVFVDSMKFREPNEKIKKEVEEVVYKLVELLKKSDKKSFEIINKKFIHPKYGFNYVKRTGAVDRFFHYKKFNIENLTNKRRAYTAIDVFIGEEFYVIPKIEWKKTEFTCDKESWLVQGLIVNDIGYNIEHRTYDFVHHTKEEKARVEFLSKEIYSVTITEWDVIFELKKIDNRWYIVLVNNSDTDCSA